MRVNPAGGLRTVPRARLKLPGHAPVAAGALLTLTLFGCAQAPVTRPPEPTWESRNKELAALRSWDLQGRIALRAGDSSGSGSLHWSQRDGEYHIRLIAPFSAGVYELSGGNGRVSLRTPGQDVLQARDAQTLMQQVLGWHLPVTGLSYWVRGLPAPAPQADGLTLDGRNRLRALTQDGWSVTYKDYAATAGPALPSRLELRAGELRVRLSIRQWKLY